MLPTPLHAAVLVVQSGWGSLDLSYQVDKEKGFSSVGGSLFSSPQPVSFHRFVTEYLLESGSVMSVMLLSAMWGTEGTAPKRRRPARGLELPYPIDRATPATAAHHTAHTHCTHTRAPSCRELFASFHSLSPWLAHVWQGVLSCLGCTVLSPAIAVPSSAACLPTSSITSIKSQL